MKTLLMSVLAAGLLVAGVQAQSLRGSTTAADKKILATLKSMKGFPAEESAPVLSIGDSMMRLLGTELDKEFKKQDIKSSSHSSLGSGLARLDAFDWKAKSVSLMAETQAKVVIVTFGANDDQVLMDPQGQKVLTGTPEWNTEYGRRVGEIMDLLIAGGAKHVVWLTLPDMKAKKLQESATKINTIFKAEADKRPDQVILFQTAPVLTAKPGKFVSYVMSSSGTPITVRDPDGVHLSTDGARRMAEALAIAFWKPAPKTKDASPEKK